MSQASSPPLNISTLWLVDSVDVEPMVELVCYLDSTVKTLGFRSPEALGDLQGFQGCTFSFFYFCSCVFPAS